MGVPLDLHCPAGKRTAIEIRDINLTSIVREANTFLGAFRACVEIQSKINPTDTRQSLLQIETTSRANVNPK